MLHRQIDVRERRTGGQPGCKGRRLLGERMTHRRQADEEPRGNGRRVHVEGWTAGWVLTTQASHKNKTGEEQTRTGPTTWKRARRAEGKSPVQAGFKAVEGDTSLSRARRRTRSIGWCAQPGPAHP
jgi:hypothetical protein